MKPKPKYKPKKNPRPLAKEISEERILQLSNDLSEGMASGTIQEWRSVALYWRNCYDQELSKVIDVRSALSPTLLGFNLFKLGVEDLQKWLNERKGE